MRSRTGRCLRRCCSPSRRSGLRRADEAPGIAESAAAIGAQTLWLQQGITSEEARRTADAAGLDYVEDLCIGATIKRLGYSKQS